MLSPLLLLLLAVQVSGDSTSLTDAFSLADDVLRQGVQVRQTRTHTCTRIQVQLGLMRCWSGHSQAEATAGGWKFAITALQPCAELGCLLWQQHRERLSLSIKTLHQIIALPVTVAC